MFVPCSVLYFVLYLRLLVLYFAYVWFLDTLRLWITVEAHCGLLYLIKFKLNDEHKYVPYNNNEFPICHLWHTLLLNLHIHFRALITKKRRVIFYSCLKHGGQKLSLKIGDQLMPLTLWCFFCATDAFACVLCKFQIWNGRLFMWAQQKVKNMIRLWTLL